MRLSVDLPDRCLICNKKTPDSLEHLFPESIGGLPKPGYSAQNVTTK